MKQSLIFNFSEIVLTFLSCTSFLVHNVAGENQFISTLVEGTEHFSPTYERMVIVRSKGFSNNLYGLRAEVQMMFRSKKTKKSLEFDETELFSNGVEDFECSALTPSEIDGLKGTEFKAEWTKQCSFTPKRYYFNSDGEEEHADHQIMNLFVKKADDREVLMRHKRVRLPQCDNSDDKATYNLLGSCGEAKSTLQLKKMLPEKPMVTHHGKKWTFLLVPGQMYEVHIQLSGSGNVELLNGIKLKSDGKRMNNENENEELQHGLVFENGCVLEERATLKGGNTYKCKIMALNHGFLHIPLIKSTRKRTIKVITHVRRLSSPITFTNKNVEALA